MTNIVILLAISFVSFLFGLHLGVKHGIEISINTAINETIKVLLTKAKELDCEPQVKKTIEETFDMEKIEL